MTAPAITPSTNQNKTHHGPEKHHAGDFQWTLIDHCCRVCFSRLVSRPADDGGRVYRCTGCGIEQAGRTPSVICSCGMKLKTGANAGLRCAPNPHRSPEFPAEITAISQSESA